MQFKDEVAPQALTKEDVTDDETDNEDDLTDGEDDAMTTISKKANTSVKKNGGNSEAEPKSKKSEESPHQQVFFNK